MACHKLCNKENILESVSYLSQELSCLGLHALHDGNSEVDADKIINAIRQLLILIKNKDDQIEDLRDRKAKLCSDLNNLRASEVRFKESLGQGEKISNVSKDEKNKLKEKLKADTIKLKSVKNEARWLKQVDQSFTARHIYAVQKKKQEIDHMNDRLRRALSGKSLGKLYGIDVSSIIGRPDRKRRQWRTESNDFKDEEEFGNFVLNTFESRQENLMNENALLKDTVTSLQEETNTVKRCMQSAAVENCHECGNLEGNPVCPSGSNGFEWNEVFEKCNGTTTASSVSAFDEVFETTSDKLKSSIIDLERLCTKCLKRKKADTIYDQCGNGLVGENGPISESHFQSWLEEINALKEKIASREYAIQTLREMINVPATPVSSPNPHLSDGFVLEEKECLSRAKQYFDEQKENFAKEKDTFTKAAMLLGRQRQEMETGQYQDSVSNISRCKIQQEALLSPSAISIRSPPLFQSSNEPSTQELYSVLCLNFSSPDEH